GPGFVTRRRPAIPVRGKWYRHRGCRSQNARDRGIDQGGGHDRLRPRDCHRLERQYLHRANDRRPAEAGLQGDVAAMKAARFVVAFALALFPATQAEAQELRVMTSGAFRAAYLQLVPEFERVT